MVACGRKIKGTIQNFMVEKERWNVDTKINYKSVTRVSWGGVAKRVIFIYVYLFSCSFNLHVRFSFSRVWPDFAHDHF